MTTTEFWEGHNSFKAGVPLENNPYEDGTKAFKDWKEGWHDARYWDSCQQENDGLDIDDWDAL